MRLGIVTDIHFSPAGTPPGRWHNPLVYDRADELLDSAIGFFEDKQLDAVVVLGDLSNFGDATSIARGVAALGRIAVPVYVVAGNHDALQSIDLWRTIIESGTSGQIGLPHASQTGSFPIRVTGIGEIHGTAAENEWHIPDGSITAPSDEPLVILVHFPLLSRVEEINAAGLKFAGAFHWDRTEAELLARTAPTILLHGHLHVRHTTVERSILQIGFASLIEPPHAVAIVEIEESAGEIIVSVEHHDIASYDVPVLPVLSPAESTLTFTDGAWNTF